MEPHYRTRNFWSLESFPVIEKTFDFWSRWVRALSPWLIRLWKWSVALNRALWIPPKDIDQRLQQAEAERRELNSHPSLWLK